MTSRRAFLAGAGAAVLAPRAALGQGMRRIAIVNATRPVEELTKTGHPFYAAFHEELEARGYVEGENLVIDRWSGRDWTDRDELARAVIASGPDLIYAASGAAIGPHLVRQTTTIPIVFLGRDPLSYGLVTNLARPGGNVTGIASEPGTEIEGKRLQLLAQAVPAAKRIAYLNARWAWAEVEPVVLGAAASLDVAIVPEILDAAVDEPVYRAAFARIEAADADAVFLGAGQENNSFAPFLAELAMAARLPAIQASADFAASGGLMSYGVNFARELRRAAAYVARILDGENPGDLPVRQPEEFDLILNLTTAEALGVSLPPALMIQATQLIE